MRYFRISHISRYIIRHFFFPFVSSLSFVTAIILIFYMKEVIKGAVEKGIPGVLLMKLLLSSTGWTLGLTIPMAALLATIVAVGQMNTDSEIIALRAGGISYFRIFRPLLVLGIFLAGFQLWFNQFVVPYSTLQMDGIIRAIRNYDPTIAIDPGLFIKLDEKNGVARYIFVEKAVKNPLTKSSTLYNIQLRQTKEIDKTLRVEQLTIAQKGKKIIKEIDGKPVKALRLYNGYFFVMDRNNKQLQRVDFNKGYMDFNLHEVGDSGSYSGNSGKIETMNYFRLEKNIHDEQNNDTKNRLLLEQEKRFAKPIATLLFIFLGFPLAIVNRRSGKGGAIGMAMIFIFLYFVLLLSADTLVVNQHLFSPFWAAWLSNLSVFVAGVYFYITRTTENIFSWRK